MASRACFCSTAASLTRKTKDLMATSKEGTVTGKCQRKFRKMLFELSGRLKLKDCQNICFLADLPLPGCCSATDDRCNSQLCVLGSLEANGHITPWNVDKLESLLSEIHRKDLVSIVASYRKSKEYKNALKETFAEETYQNVQMGDTQRGEKSDRKKRLRSLYTLLITHITGLTQVMEIIREELDRAEEEEGAVMERFVKVADDGEIFTENLHRVLQEMGIKPNRNSTSSEEAAAPIPGEREVKGNE